MRTTRVEGIAVGKQPTIWMVAAENGALPGGKIGGVGDVLRDLPVAVARQGCRVRVITPAYGRLHQLPAARFHRRLSFEFGGRVHRASIFRFKPQHDALELFVIEHQAITQGRPGAIYVHDGDERPFYTDSGRFAFFGAAVAAWIEAARQPPDVVHLHDWHSAMVTLLRARSAPGSRLQRVRLVYTIHNLAYQGIRPLRGEASLAAWFPGVQHAAEQVADPRYPDCVNFTATAIRLADQLTTVSPTYAREILEPSDPARGFHGGEGLEADLRAANAQGRLCGILNGCAYPERTARAPRWITVLQRLRAETGLIASSAGAEAWLSRQRNRRPAAVLLSIGRITGQKSRLFLEPAGGAVTALDALLQKLGNEAVFIMLGSGERSLEGQFAAIARRQPRFLFLRGFAEALSDLLYRSGDLFLMPSSFEPCGISQMLAMRAGQPCVVHSVGGLVDTVRHGIDGFRFSGATPAQQADALVRTVAEALEWRRRDPAGWEAMRRAAAAARFSWDRAAEAYLAGIYRAPA